MWSEESRGLIIAYFYQKEVGMKKVTTTGFWSLVVGAIFLFSGISGAADWKKLTWDKVSEE